MGIAAVPSQQSVEHRPTERQSLGSLLEVFRAQAFLCHQGFENLFSPRGFRPSRLARRVDILTFQYGPPCSLARLCEEKRFTN